MSGVTHCWKSWGWQLGLMSGLAIAESLAELSIEIAFSKNRAFAQVTADPSVGTVVTPNDATFEITGGTTVGDTNLFHSFSSFSVPNGGIADFLNAPAIANILARVTGGSPSDIQGLIRTQGNANLFLMNPNGIIFGENSSLDVRGSFVATTANAIGLANGDIFSANPVEPLPNQLLNVNPNAFLFNQIAAQPILNRSTANSTGLQVPQGQSLLLVGGPVRLEGGQMQAPGGRVELGGVAGSGTVGLSVNGNDLHLSFPVGVQRADVSLNNSARVNVSAGGGGSIAINAMNLNMAGASRLRAGIDSGRGSIGSMAGDIEINASGTINLTNESLIANVVLPGAVGKGGSIDITTRSLLVMNGAQLFADTYGQGDAGSVNITARDTVSFDGVGSNGFLSGAFNIVEAGAVGKGGGINITTGSLLVMNGAQLSADTHGHGDAGHVNITARDTVSFDETSSNGYPSGVFSTVEAGAVGRGGDINIVTRSLSVMNGAQLVIYASGQGDGGRVNITARDTVSFDGVNSDGSPSGVFNSVNPGVVGNTDDINITTGSLSVTNGAILGTTTFGRGDAGSVNIHARDTVSFNGLSRDTRSPSAAYSNVATEAVGKGGDINIVTRSLSVTNGAQLTSSTSGQGDSGSVNIHARDTVSFDGAVFGTRFSSAAISRVNLGAIGKGGDINITTGSLSVTNGAELDASSFGQGDGGSVNIHARDTVSFDGVGSKGSPSAAYSTVERGAVGNGGGINISTRLLSLTNGAQLNAVTTVQGDGGNITINAHTLEAVNGGQVLTTSLSSGNAGNIILNVTDSVTLSGSDPTYSDRLARFGKDIVVPAEPSSGLFANTSENSTGLGGSLTITTEQLNVQDGAQVSVSNQGSGNAGSLRLEADSIFLNNQGKLQASTASGEGGNIDLQVGDLILMRRNSLISARADNNGNGGNITINAPFIVAVPSENSDIVANAFRGRGGNINITTQGIFGLEYRQELTPESDINASSEFGVDGTVEINSPDVDPSRGLVNLPVEPANPELAQGCQVGIGQTQSEFVVTGRGGLPPNPREALTSDAVEVGLVTLNPSEENHSRQAVSTNPTSPTPAPIVEAQGWIINAKGEVVLTATAPPITPHSSWQSSVDCRVLQSQPTSG